LAPRFRGFFRTGSVREIDVLAPVEQRAGGHSRHGESQFASAHGRIAALLPVALLHGALPGLSGPCGSALFPGSGHHAASVSCTFGKGIIYLTPEIR
jgi:hypothetical protein